MNTKANTKKCWPLALMPADRRRYPPLAVAIPSPPAGCLVPRLPLPQARRSREFMPPSAAHPGPPFAGDHAAGPPLTQPHGSRPQTRPGVPCHVPGVMVFKSCCAHRNILNYLVLSCPWRLVWGRRLLLLWLRRPFQPPASLSWKR